MNRLPGLALVSALAVLAPRAAVAAPEPPAAAAAPRIHWLPFNEAALKTAADAGKPILLDISAAWDHSAQVMSTLTYAEPAVVALVESSYVPVRVDTDDRPDLFARYGMGGWPTTAILLPDGQPVYYPDKDDRVSRAGGLFYPPDTFRAYFSQLAAYYAKNTEMVTRVTRNVDDKILEKRNVETGAVTAEAVESIVAKILDTYKFRPDVPEPGERHPDFDMAELTFAYWARKADRKVLDAGLGHLTEISRGGVYDQLGGGFHRYAHDTMYLVPSFEKLPVTQAGAIRAFLDAFEVTGNGVYLNVATGTIDHVLKHGIDPVSKAFIGAMASGASVADNGDYYTWTEDEAKAVLDEEEFKVASVGWNIFPTGEMVDVAPKRNVLFVAEGPKALAVHLKIDEKHAGDVLESARAKLLKARDARPTPPTDPRAFGDSGSALASAFLHAGRILHRDDLTGQALAAVDALSQRCVRPDGLLAHACEPAAGTRSTEAFLADQAAFVNALLDVHEQAGAATPLAQARTLADRATTRFKDAIAGGLSDRAIDAAAPGLLSWPVRDLKDNMEMVRGLRRLGHLTGERAFLDRAKKILESFADEIGAYGEHAAPFALTASMLLNPPLEILVVGDPGDPATVKARERALSLYHPWRVVRHYAASDGRAALHAKGLKALDGAQVAFCVGAECAGPYPGDEPMRKHLEAFLSPGSKGAVAAPESKTGKNGESKGGS
ncbi:MAG: thioredoxin domain-containing protein [Acidobacteria bacterium]|nr:thioredoxin domain-containing protein [Acidobacteriota bacterium]